MSSSPRHENLTPPSDVKNTALHQNSLCGQIPGRPGAFTEFPRGYHGHALHTDIPQGFREGLE